MHPTAPRDERARETDDTERIDWLASVVGNLDAKAEVFFAGLGVSGMAAGYQCELAPVTSAGMAAWRSFQGSTLREAIDRARAAAGGSDHGP